MAHFEYEPVGLRSLVVPPFEIEHRPEIKTMLINKDLEKLSRNAQAVPPPEHHNLQLSHHPTLHAFLTF